jgi:hypothetical protein
MLYTITTVIYGCNKISCGGHCVHVHSLAYFVTAVSYNCKLFIVLNPAVI